MSPSGCVCLGRKVRLVQDLGFDHGQFLLQLCQRKELLALLLPAALPHALLQVCLCPALALLTQTLSCLLNFSACLENPLNSAASPGDCWTVTNPGPQPWYQPSLSLDYWGMVGLPFTEEEKGEYGLLWVPAAPPGLCPVACTDP